MKGQRSRSDKGTAAGSKRSQSRAEVRVGIDAPTRLWDADLGDALGAWTSSPGRVLVGTASGEVRSYDARLGTLISKIELSSPILALTLTTGPHAPSRLAVSTADKRLAIFEPNRPEPLSEHTFGCWVEALAWLPAAYGLSLVVGAGKSLVVLDEHPNWAHRPIAELKSTVTGLVVSPDGGQVAVSAYGGISMWRLRDWTRRDLSCKGSMLGLSWSPDGRVIVCPTQENDLRFWRLPLGQDAVMSGYPAKPRALAWTADGRLLATGGSSEVTLWRFSSRSPEGTRPILLAGHVDEVTAVDFHPTGRLLASGSRDGQVRLWSVGGESPSILISCEAESPRSAVAALFWSDARTLSAIYAHGIITTWALAP